MRRTGWERIFEGHGGARKEVLVLLSELPTSTGHSLHLGDHDGQALQSSADDERKLALMVVALDRLLDRCGDTVQHTDVSLRRWLRSIILGRSFKAPFELVTRPSSERAYRNEYKRCLCFWLRLWRHPRATTKLITRRGFSRPQAMALTRLWDDQVWETEEPTMGCYATKYVGDEPTVCSRPAFFLQRASAAQSTSIFLLFCPKRERTINAPTLRPCVAPFGRRQLNLGVKSKRASTPCVTVGSNLGV